MLKVHKLVTTWFTGGSISNTTQGIAGAIVTGNGKIQQCRFIVYSFSLNELIHYEYISFSFLQL